MAERKERKPQQQQKLMCVNYTTTTLLDCGFEPRRYHECLSLLRVVGSQVEVSATGRSPVRMNHTECGVSI